MWARGSVRTATRSESPMPLRSQALRPCRRARATHRGSRSSTPARTVGASPPATSVFENGHAERHDPHEARAPAPGFFARLFGMDSITVGSHAKARAGVPTSARWVAPITVSIEHQDPLLRAGSVFDEATRIDLNNSWARRGPARSACSTSTGPSGIPARRTSTAGCCGGTAAGWTSEYRSAPSTLFNRAPCLRQSPSAYVSVRKCCSRSTPQNLAAARTPRVQHHRLDRLHDHVLRQPRVGGWVSATSPGVIWEGSPRPVRRRRTSASVNHAHRLAR